MTKASQDVASEFLTLAVRARRSEPEDAGLSSAYDRIGDQGCLRLARDNQVLPLVATSLLSVRGDSLPLHWSEIASSNRERVERRIGTLVDVVDHLEREGFHPAVIEGGGTLLGTDLPVAAYCAGDFDLLVHPDRWPDLPVLMKSLGFQADDRRGRPTNRIEFRRASREDHIEWLEIGSAPFDRMWVPLHHRDPTLGWLERRIPSRKAPTVHVLASEDAVVLGAMHTSLHSFVRAPGIRLYLDIDRPACDCAVDWHQVHARMVDMEARRRCGVSLAFSAMLLGSPVPAFVYESVAKERVRWSSIQALLEKKIVLGEKQKRLGRAGTVLLDLLVDEQPPHQWLSSLLFPDTTWLELHFDRAGELRGRRYQLLLKRYGQILPRWRPE